MISSSMAALFMLKWKRFLLVHDLVLAVKVLPSIALPFPAITAPNILLPPVYGRRKVVFVEPYPNSKAVEFHSDSTSFRFNGATDTVLFEPFVSVGPRHFVDLFSMNLGAGYPLSRKDQEDHIIDWYPEKARLRM